MLAVIKTGGKQYKVKVGDRLKLEKLEAEEGQTVSLDQVLFWSDEKNVKIGAPVLEKAVVEVKVLKQARSKKVTIIKYNAKKRYKKKQGHRQHFSEVEVLSIKA